MAIAAAADGDKIFPALHHRRGTFFGCAAVDAEGNYQGDGSDHGDRQKHGFPMFHGFPFQVCDQSVTENKSKSPALNQVRKCAGQITARDF
jgi:hypothetical protein